MYLLVSVDVIYGDITVPDKIVGYVRFEIGHPWPPHLLLKFP